MVNTVKIVLEGDEDKTYIIPHRWLADSIPILAGKLEWDKMIGGPKDNNDDDSKQGVIRLTRQTYAGEVTSDLFEHFIEFACASHYKISHFRQPENFHWDKLDVLVG